VGEPCVFLRPKGVWFPPASATGARAKSASAGVSINSPRTAQTRHTEEEGGAGRGAAPSRPSDSSTHSSYRGVTGVRRGDRAAVAVADPTDAAAAAGKPLAFRPCLPSDVSPGVVLQLLHSLAAREVCFAHVRAADLRALVGVDSGSSGPNDSGCGVLSVLSCSCG
jgi:hypothetical protein